MTAASFDFIRFIHIVLFNNIPILTYLFTTDLVNDSSIMSSTPFDRVKSAPVARHDVTSVPVVTPIASITGKKHLVVYCLTGTYWYSGTVVLGTEI